MGRRVPWKPPGRIDLFTNCHSSTLFVPGLPALLSRNVSSDLHFYVLFWIFFWFPSFICEIGLPHVRHPKVRLCCPLSELSHFFDFGSNFQIPPRPLFLNSTPRNIIKYQYNYVLILNQVSVCWLVSSGVWSNSRRPSSSPRRQGQHPVSLLWPHILWRSCSE
jgi:hypothetical protein